MKGTRTLHELGNIMNWRFYFLHWFS